MCGLAMWRAPVAFPGNLGLAGRASSLGGHNILTMSGPVKSARARGWETLIMQDPCKSGPPKLGARLVEKGWRERKGKFFNGHRRDTEEAVVGLLRLLGQPLARQVRL